MKLYKVSVRSEFDSLGGRTGPLPKDLCVYVTHPLKVEDFTAVSEAAKDFLENTGWKREGLRVYEVSFVTGFATVVRGGGE